MAEHEHEHEQHYLTRTWHVDTKEESERLKDILSRNGFNVTLDEARDIIIKFFESPVTQKLIFTRSFPVSTQLYTGDILQDITIDPKQVIAIPIDFEIIHGKDNIYEFTLVVINNDFYGILDFSELKLNYGFYDPEKKEILNAFIGVEGIN